MKIIIILFSISNFKKLLQTLVLILTNGSHSQIKPQEDLLLHVINTSFVLL